MDHRRSRGSYKQNGRLSAREAEDHPVSFECEIITSGNRLTWSAVGKCKLRAKSSRRLARLIPEYGPALVACGRKRASRDS